MAQWDISRWSDWSALPRRFLGYCRSRLLSARLSAQAKLGSSGVALSTTSMAVVYAGHVRKPGFNRPRFWQRGILGACFITDLGTSLPRACYFHPSPIRRLYSLSPPLSCWGRSPQ